MPLHKAANYKPVDITNPFREGQDKAYSDILLDKMNEMKWWRTIIGSGVLILFLVSFCFFVYATGLQKTVPVLINVMPNGETQYLGEVRQNAVIQVPESAILFQVKKFISNLRSVSSDREVLYNNITECYDMITSSYEPAMTRLLRGASPFDLIGNTRRTVETESVLKVTGSSYQIDWLENEISITSSFTPKQKRMRALVTVQLLPTDNNTVKKNPLGIYIENCEMTEL